MSTDDLNMESVEMLRERLDTMKRIMAERTNSQQQQQQQQQQQPQHQYYQHHQHSNFAEGILNSSRYMGSAQGHIDGKFLNFAFGGALLVIITVSVYAFYSLYNAILKKFPSHHTEL